MDSIYLLSKLVINNKQNSTYGDKVEYFNQFLLSVYQIMMGKFHQIILGKFLTYYYVPYSYVLFLSKEMPTINIKIYQIGPELLLALWTAIANILACIKTAQLIWCNHRLQ